MTTIAHLRALQAIISTALDDIGRVYSENGVDFPSIDNPVYTNNPSRDVSDEVKAAEKLTANGTVSKATQSLVAACGQLTTVVNKPFITLTEGVVAVGGLNNQMFLEQSSIVEILRAASPGGLHVNEIAKQVDEIRSVNGSVPKPLDPCQLSHILRLLASHHWIREVTPDVFANNRLTSYIDSGKTPQQLRSDPMKKYDDTDGISALIPMVTAENFRTMSYFTEYLLSPRPGHQYATAFNYAYQTDEPMYAFYERPENALRLKQVSRGMSAAAAGEGNGDVSSTSVLPWDKLPKDSVVVDVGGGIGSVSVRVALAHSHLRFIVQDRAKTIAMGPMLFKQFQATLFDTGRITFEAHDFLEEQPKRAQPPAVFILCRIMHNLDDERSKKILSRLRAAAGPETKLLICDQILLLACREPESESVLKPLVPADSPLLPNLGKAFAVGYHFDLVMSAMMNGKERTLREFEELGAATGWKISHIERAEGSVWAYTTLVPV